MLLAVSGIVHATASFETVAAEIEVSCVVRVFSRSPFGIVHGTADAAGDVAGVADHPGGDQQGEEEQPDPDVAEIVLDAVRLLWLCLVWGRHEKSGRRDPGEPVAPRHRHSLVRVAEKDPTRPRNRGR